MTSLTFDPTFNIGTIISLLTVVSLIVGMVRISNTHAVDMALLKKGQSDQQLSIGELKGDVATVSGKIEGLAVIQQRLADGKERMDQLEERVRNIESTSHGNRRAGDRPT